VAQHSRSKGKMQNNLFNLNEKKKMKKLVFALCMVFGAVAVNAQDSTSTSSPTDPSTSTQSTQATTGMEDQGRVKIKSQELPDAVKSSLESQEYRGWLVNSAYKVDAASNSSVGSTSESSTSGSTSGSTSDSTSVGGNTSSGAYAQEAYIVELKNGAQTKTVRFDKDGKKLDDGDQNMNDQK
jgi:hypothetical protein